MRIKFILLTLFLAAVAGGWLAEHAAAVRLQAQLTAVRDQRREHRALLAERDRLRRLLPEALHRAAAVPAATSGDEMTRAAVAAPAAPFALGEWRPSAAWRNEGQATARAAVATALWAAAGGDVPALQAVLEFDDASRLKAGELLATLPPAARNTYASPEDFVASVTLKNIPLTAAQVAWFHESDADHAAVGLLLASADRSPASAEANPAGATGEPPPMLSDPRVSQLAFLNLHRSATGWRVMVPVAAVNRIAGELTAPRE